MLRAKQRDKNPPNIFKELLKDECGIERQYRTLRETQIQGNMPMHRLFPINTMEGRWETGDILPWWYRPEGWEQLLRWKHFETYQAPLLRNKSLKLLYGLQRPFSFTSSELKWRPIVAERRGKITPTPREEGGNYLEARPFKGSYHRRKDVNLEKYLANDPWAGLS